MIEVIIKNMLTGKTLPLNCEFYQLKDAVNLIETYGIYMDVEKCQFEDAYFANDPNVSDYVYFEIAVKSDKNTI